MPHAVLWPQRDLGGCRGEGVREAASALQAAFGRGPALGCPVPAAEGARGQRGPAGAGGEGSGAVAAGQRAAGAVLPAALDPGGRDPALPPRHGFRLVASLTASLPQDPVPSKAASVQPPAQKLRCELRRLLVERGESWSEELERDVPRTWQRHGDLVLLSEDSFSAALWAELGEQSGAAHRAAVWMLLASPSAPSMAALQAPCYGRRSRRLWAPSAWPSEDGCCQTRCAPPLSPCCWATTAGWSTWTMAFGRRSSDVGHGC